MAGMGRSVALAAVCLAWMACVSMSVPIPASQGHTFAPALAQDTPYVEHVSMRLVTSNMTAIEGWGQLPTPAALQVENGVFQGVQGVWVLGTDYVYFASLPPTPYGTAPTPLLPPTVARPSNYTAVLATAGSCSHCNRMVVSSSGALVGLASGTDGVYQYVDCSSGSAKCTVTKKVPGASTGRLYAAAVGRTEGEVWVASDGGVARVTTAGVNVVDAVKAAVTGLAVSPDATLVAAGTAEKLFLIDAATLGVERWEWVTDVATGSGGVVDAPITTMAFDACGSLWIGNDICVNVMFKDRSFIRISGLHGLPFHNVTSIARDDGSFPGTGSVGDMWVGTLDGLSRYSPANRQCVSTENPSKVGDWVYYWGRRWLPGNNVTWVSSSGNTSYVATNGGIARIQRETWTLERKAELFAQIVPRHNRHGFTADCSLPSPGNLTGIQCHPGESDGLWTGIMATSEVLRYAVKKDATSASIAGVRMKAMNFLSQVTGIGGYMARTAALYQNAPKSTQWHNSTTFPGWAWQGDTSADEVVGHMFAFPLAQALLGNASGQETMIHDRINKLVGYIVQNGYYEVGYNGQHTKWGIWAPSYVNDLRSWSDQRGLNSMQMLCFLNVAYMVTGNETFLESLETLSNSTNQYQENQVNLKIESPSDDNFSDSELAFLPFYSYLFFNDSAKLTKAGLTRSFNFARKERSSLYSAIYMATTGIADSQAAEDVLWDLRTWPLEWVSWNTRNSQRLDIYVNPQENRDMKHGTMSVRVLPGNERDQFRWNHNPFTLDDGSDGMVEFDPGAWLVAYWMARFHGIVAAA